MFLKKNIKKEWSLKHHLGVTRYMTRAMPQINLFCIKNIKKK